MERDKDNTWRLPEQVKRNCDVKYKTGLQAMESHWEDSNAEMGTEEIPGMVTTHGQMLVL